MNENSCDVLIIGSGITGLTIAFELLDRGVDDILIIDKENEAGRHASGRNSGVLHSGIYYSPGTLKAKFCAEGNKLLKEFCLENNIVINCNGKVIVATDRTRLENLHELKRRADFAGAVSHIIDTEELHKLEPYAYSCEKALYCPETAVFRPMEILNKLQELLISSGKARIFFNTRFDSLLSGKRIKSNNSIIKFEKVINASGAFSEKIAESFGFDHRYKILPFKGTYKKLREQSQYLVNANVYPVPDLNNPFLGVHYTKSADGEVFVGPTAIPALGRENYGILENLDIESFQIISRDCYMLLSDNTFRSTAIKEMRKYLDYFFWTEARLLIPSVKKEDLIDTRKVGIRPQLIDWNSGKLVMDFIILKDQESIHILNAISPGFTTSMAFAKYIADSLLGE